MDCIDNLLFKKISKQSLLLFSILSSVNMSYAMYIDERCQNERTSPDTVGRIGINGADGDILHEVQKYITKEYLNAENIAYDMLLAIRSVSLADNKDTAKQLLGHKKTLKEIRSTMLNLSFDPDAQQNASQDIPQEQCHTIFQHIQKIYQMNQPISDLIKNAKAYQEKIDKYKECVTQKHELVYDLLLITQQSIEYKLRRAEYEQDKDMIAKMTKASNDINVAQDTLIEILQGNTIDKNDEDAPKYIIFSDLEKAYLELQRQIIEADTNGIICDNRGKYLVKVLKSTGGKPLDKASYTTIDETPYKKLEEDKERIAQLAEELRIICDEIKGLQTRESLRRHVELIDKKKEELNTSIKEIENNEVYKEYKEKMELQEKINTHIHNIEKIISEIDTYVEELGGAAKANDIQEYLPQANQLELDCNDAVHKYNEYKYLLIVDALKEYETQFAEIFEKINNLLQTMKRKMSKKDK